MKIKNIIPGTFQERPNRFTVLFETDGETEKAHLRDPGRLKELLIQDTPLLLRPADNLTNRKTKFDVMAVWKDGIWVLINSGLHSDLAAELIESGLVEEFLPYSIEKREYTFGNSRIDFLLSDEVDKKMLLEVKGCTLVEEGLAKFPDAPTLRGKRHVEELIKAKEEGFNSAVLFLIMRDDAVEFSPNWEMDPEFSNTLKVARENGVEIIAYSFEIILEEKYLNINPFKPVDVII